MEKANDVGYLLLPYHFNSCVISTGSATSDGLLMEVCGCFVCVCGIVAGNRLASEGMCVLGLY